MAIVCPRSNPCVLQVPCLSGTLCEGLVEYTGLALSLDRDGTITVGVMEQYMDATDLPYRLTDQSIDPAFQPVLMLKDVVKSGEYNRYLSKKPTRPVKESESSERDVKPCNPADLVKDVGCALELPDFMSDEEDTVDSVPSSQRSELSCHQDSSTDGEAEEDHKKSSRNKEEPMVTESDKAEPGSQKVALKDCRVVLPPPEETVIQKEQTAADRKAERKVSEGQVTGETVTHKDSVPSVVRVGSESKHSAVTKPPAATSHSPPVQALAGPGQDSSAQKPANQAAEHKEKNSDKGPASQHAERNREKDRHKTSSSKHSEHKRPKDSKLPADHQAEQKHKKKSSKTLTQVKPTLTIKPHSDHKHGSHGSKSSSSSSSKKDKTSSLKKPHVNTSHSTKSKDDHIESSKKHQVSGFALWMKSLNKKPVSSKSHKPARSSTKVAGSLQAPEKARPTTSPAETPDDALPDIRPPVRKPRPPFLLKADDKEEKEAKKRHKSHDSQESLDSQEDDTDKESRDRKPCPTPVLKADEKKKEAKKRHKSHDSQGSRDSQEDDTDKESRGSHDRKPCPTPVLKADEKKKEAKKRHKSHDSQRSRDSQEDDTDKESRGSHDRKPCPTPVLKADEKKKEAKKRHKSHDSQGSRDSQEDDTDKESRGSHDRKPCPTPVLKADEKKKEAKKRHKSHDSQGSRYSQEDDTDKESCTLSTGSQDQQDRQGKKREGRQGVKRQGGKITSAIETKRKPPNKETIQAQLDEPVKNQEGQHGVKKQQEDMSAKSKRKSPSPVSGDSIAPQAAAEKKNKQSPRAEEQMEIPSDVDAIPPGSPSTVDSSAAPDQSRSPAASSPASPRQPADQNPPSAPSSQASPSPVNKQNSPRATPARTSPSPVKTLLPQSGHMTQGFLTMAAVAKGVNGDAHKTSPSQPAAPGQISKPTPDVVLGVEARSLESRPSDSSQVKKFLTRDYKAVDDRLEKLRCYRAEMQRRGDRRGEENCRMEMNRLKVDMQIISDELNIENLFLITHHSLPAKLLLYQEADKDLSVEGVPLVPLEPLKPASYKKLQKLRVSRREWEGRGGWTRQVGGCNRLFHGLLAQP